MKTTFRILAGLVALILVFTGFSSVRDGSSREVSARRDDRARFNPMRREYRQIRDRDHVVRLREMPPLVGEGEIEGPPGEAGEPTEPLDCSFEDIAGLDAAQTVAYLQSHDADCLYFLWTPGESLPEVFTQEKMLAVMAAIEQESAHYDATRDNSGNLLELLRFVRIGFYHDFYEEPVAFDHAAIRDETIDMLRSIEETSALLAPLDDNHWTTDAEDILREWIVTVDTVTDILAAFYPTFEWIVTFFADDELLLARLAERPVQGNVIYSTLFGLRRGLYFADVQEAVQPQLVSKVETLALNEALVEDEVWLVNNGIWTLGGIVLRLENDLGDQALGGVEQAYLIYDPEDDLEIEPHLWAVMSLPIAEGDCYTSTDNSWQICPDELAQQIRAQLFPFKYVLEDGATIVETPLDNETVMDLYSAAEQVFRQFVSVTGYADPRPEDTNETLSMVIYGSRQEYEVFHTFLTGLGTNNGGIYIESIATFYTYQREPYESIYTLEDLTRHEYVHYLSGRYLIEGGFYELEFYEDDRLTWFDEGFAEFVAGSTWSGVETRAVLVEQVAGDQQSMSVEEIVHAAYGSGFKFYRYAALLIEYLLVSGEGHDVQLSELITAIRDTDVEGYDAIVDGLAVVDDGFQAFLEGLTGSPEEEWPVAPYVYEIAWPDAGLDAKCRDPLLKDLTVWNVVNAILPGDVACRATNPVRVPAENDIYYEYVGDMTCIPEDLPGQADLEDFSQAMADQGFPDFSINLPELPLQATHAVVTGPVEGEPCLAFRGGSRPAGRDDRRGRYGNPD